MIGRGSGGSVGAEPLGQAAFTSLPAGTGSPAGWSSPVLAAVVRRRRRRHRIPAATLRAVFHLDSHHLRCSRRHRLGALPLALVHPMSDSDSRTEKRKVNTPRLSGRRLGMERRQGPQPPLRLHLSPVSHVRVEALVYPAWRAAAGGERLESGRGRCVPRHFWGRVVGTEAAGT